MFKKLLLLILLILLCQAAGFIGSIPTISAIDSWYKFLNKPLFSPPNWIFMPVWTTLYTLMGISFYLIVISKKNIVARKRAIILFLIHLAFNSLWSLIFFGLKNVGLALLEIIMLDALVVAVMVNFYRIKKIAAYLLIPYLTWILFASFLTYSIYILN